MSNSDDECKTVHCPYKLTMVEIIGWVGAIFLTIAYFLIQTNKVDNNNTGYIILNTIGSFLLLLNAIEHRSYPSLTINLIWFVIGIYSLNNSVIY